MLSLLKSIKGLFIMTDSFMGSHHIILGAISGAELPLILFGLGSIYAIIHALILIIKGPKWGNRTSYEKFISIAGIVLGVFLLIGILLPKI
jgi:hypothetical protein